MRARHRHMFPVVLRPYLCIILGAGFCLSARRKAALTLTYSLHTMEKVACAEPPVFPDEQTSLLRPTTQALEAAAPHLRPACPAGTAAGQHLRGRPDADEALAGAVFAGAEAQ